MMATRSLDDARRRLLARRNALLSRYRDLVDRADGATATREPDVLDHAENEWDARVLSTMSDADANALADVVAALVRIDCDAYGICTHCGEAIDARRLRALPAAALCVDCAGDAEKSVPRWTFAAGA